MEKEKTQLDAKHSYEHVETSGGGGGSGLPGAVHDAVQAVGNGEDSAVRELLADGGLNQIVCLQVDGCSGLVQD